MLSRQKLGIILENKMSENWSYQNMSTEKVVLSPKLISINENQS